MKHLKIGTKVMAASLVTATLAGTIDTTAFAAPVKTEYTISVVSCGEELSETWKELCDKIANGNWSDCPVLPLPGESLPTLPGGNQPGNDQPDTDKPETDKPETDQPETDKPETSEPDAEGNLSFAKQVVNLVNEERAKAGVSALVLDETLASAAMVRATEIETSFSHTRPDGRSFSTVLSDMGIQYRRSGENIAWGQQSPKAVMEGWMNSKGHRANILNPNFTKIGVGYRKNAAGRTYWTQLFMS